VDVHVSHSGLGETHELLNILSLNIIVHFTIDSADEERGKGHHFLQKSHQRLGPGIFHVGLSFTSHYCFSEGQKSLVEAIPEVYLDLLRGSLHDVGRDRLGIFRE